MKKNPIHCIIATLLVLFSLANPAYVFSWDKQASPVKQYKRDYAKMRKELLGSALEYEKQGDAKAVKNDFPGAISDYAQAILLIPASATDSVEKQQILLLKQVRANLLLHGRIGVERFFVDRLLSPDKDSKIILHALLGEYDATLAAMDRRHELGLSKQSKEQLINTIKTAISNKKYSDIERAFLILRTITDTIGGFDYPATYYKEMFRPDHADLQKTFPKLFERYIAFSKTQETRLAQYESKGKELVNHFPDHALGYLLVAYSQWREKQWQALATSLDMATKKAPYFSDDLDWMLNDLTEHGYAAEAKNIAHRINATSPDNSKILESLFVADLTLKDYPAALNIILSNEKRFSEDSKSIIPVLYLQSKDWPNAQQRFLKLAEDEKMQVVAYMFLLAGQQEGFFSLDSEMLQKLDQFRKGVLETDSDMMKNFENIVEKFSTVDFFFDMT